MTKKKKLLVAILTVVFSILMVNRALANNDNPCPVRAANFNDPHCPTTTTTEPDDYNGNPSVSSYCVDGNWVLTNTGNVDAYLTFTPSGETVLEPGQSKVASARQTSVSIFFQGNGGDTIIPRPENCSGDTNSTTTTTIADEVTTTTTIVDEVTTTTVEQAGPTTTATSTETSPSTSVENTNPSTTVRAALPATGSSSTNLVVIALTMIGIGAVILRLTSNKY